MRYLVQAILELPLCFSAASYRECRSYALSQRHPFGYRDYLALVWDDFKYVASGRRAQDECWAVDQEMRDNAY